MKKFVYFLPIISIFALASCGTSNYTQDYSPRPSVGLSVSYQGFYDGLSPYGRWVDYPNQGYVWIPNEAGFRPYYSNGHWAFTTYGWTWVSSYDWGWAPFHYGRWMNDAAYGWLWIPGHQWAPAWVSWRSNAECYGWAPLGPGISVGVSFGMNIPDEHWAFVPRQHIYEQNINNYYINQTRNVTIVNNTTVINNNYYTNNNNTAVYAKGPDAKEVEQATHTRITPLAVKETSKPGTAQLSNGTLAMYKPVVQADNKQANIRPANPVALKDLSKERNMNKRDDNFRKEDVINNPSLPVHKDPVQDQNTNKGFHKPDVQNSNNVNTQPVQDPNGNKKYVKPGVENNNNVNTQPVHDLNTQRTKKPVNSDVVVPQQDMQGRIPGKGQGKNGNNPGLNNDPLAQKNMNRTPVNPPNNGSPRNNKMRFMNNQQNKKMQGRGKDRDKGDGGNVKNKM